METGCLAITGPQTLWTNIKNSTDKLRDTSFKVHEEHRHTNTAALHLSTCHCFMESSSGDRRLL